MQVCGTDLGFKGEVFQCAKRLVFAENNVQRFVLGFTDDRIMLQILINRIDILPDLRVVRQVADGGKMVLDIMRKGLQIFVLLL